MTSRDFCYWLQGFFEITGPRPTIDETQAKMIREHLALVFQHDPSVNQPPDQQRPKSALDIFAPSGFDPTTVRSYC